MRNRASQWFRLGLLLGGFSMGNLSPAIAAEIPFPSHFPGPNPPRLMECGAGGARYPQAWQEFEQGKLLAAAGDAGCVDWFFSSAEKSWDDLKEGLTQNPPRLLGGSLQLYNSAVLSCVIAGHRLGRLDPAMGLKISVDGQWQTIPIVGVGLVWRLDQIDCLRPVVTEFQNPHFARTVKHAVGAALMGIHYRGRDIPGEERYLDHHPMAITVVLRADGSGENRRLEFHDPTSSQTLDIAGRELALSKNIAGAVAFAMAELQTNVNPWSAFFDPEIAVNHQGILMLQPYQPGKIPVVLVHGLLSNPATWGTMLNEFYNNPALMEHFQIWAYLYPTSVTFVQTAAEFRKDLCQTLGFLDPTRQDPALEDMVLVGHSMGGLLSQLQVTWSGEFLWNEFAKVPFGEIRGSARLLQTLSQIFFFGPQSCVHRVIFMATPHQGSGMSSRVIGCWGRLLAGRLPALQSQWTELRRENPGALRTPAFPFRLPSSVDALAPGSPALRGLAKLPFSPGVHLHSIIGTGGCKPCYPGDGVVTIDSARLRGVESEFFVKADHEGVKEDPDALREVERILWLHWAEYLHQNQQPAPERIIPAPAPSFAP
jgi:Alpha/beta hydrolase family